MNLKRSGRTCYLETIVEKIYNKAFKRIRNSLLGSASLHILANSYSPLNAALNSPHQLSPLFRREFLYLPYQPLYPAFLHDFANLSSPPQQSRCSNPKLSSYLLYLQVGIGAGGDANVTVAKQLTGGLPVVSTSAAEHHAPTGD